MKLERQPEHNQSKEVSALDTALSHGMNLKKMLAAAEKSADTNKIAEIHEMIAENQKQIKELDKRYSVVKEDIWQGRTDGIEIDDRRASA